MRPSSTQPLIYAWTEVSKAAKTAAERSAKHEPTVAILSDKAAWPRTTLQESSKNARGALACAEKGREKWAKRKSSH